MESGRRTETDQTLDELGRAPADLTALIERCLGRSRIGVAQADEMLASLTTRQEIAHRGTGSAGARSRIQTLGPMQILPSVEPTDVGTVGFARSAGLQMPANLADPVASSGDAIRESVQPARREAIDPKDGPLTHRMDAREARKSVPAGRSRFSDGLQGADDLPVFPPRSPIPAKAVAPQPAAAAVTAEEETSDGFEILVDDELLELDPDDV